MTPTRRWTISDVLQATGGAVVFGQRTAPLSGISTDSRTIERDALFVALAGDQFDGHRFVGQALEKGAGAVLISHRDREENPRDGMDDRCWIVVPDTLKALGDLAAFHRKEHAAGVVAITGTNGKTTTKEMTAAVVGEGFSVLKTEGNFNNLIGLPLTLFRLGKEHEWAILEMGMNRPGEIARLTEICKPAVGVITNIGAGHLEGLKDLDGVMRAKGELLDGMGEDGTAVLNADDPRLCRLAEKFPGRVVSFGIHSAAEVSAVPVSQTASSNAFDLSWYDETIRVRLSILGTGAIYNALAAAAVGYRLGLSIQDVKAGLEGMRPMAGRMEILMLPGNIHIINDTYNANPASMAEAIETFCELKGAGRGIFVAGDMLELGGQAESAHKKLGSLIVRRGVTRLYVTGQHAKSVADGAIGAGMDSGKVSVGTKEAILNALTERLVPGDWVLVKGSRRMAMEDVVNGLKTRLGEDKEALGKS